MPTHTEPKTDRVVALIPPRERIIVKEAAALTNESVSQYIRRIVVPIARSTVDASVGQDANDAD